MLSELQRPVGPVDGEGADRALLLVAHAVGLVGRVQAGAGGVHGQAARARAHLVDAARRQRPGGAVHPEEWMPRPLPGRQIHLRRQHVAERGTEGADVGEERPGGLGRSRSGPGNQSGGTMPANAVVALRNVRRDRWRSRRALTSPPVSSRRPARRGPTTDDCLRHPRHGQFALVRGSPG